MAAVQASSVFLDRVETVKAVCALTEGELIAGPPRERVGILYADVVGRMLHGPKWVLDLAGHYARPGVFQSTVDRGSRPVVRTVGSAEPTSRPEPPELPEPTESD